MSHEVLAWDSEFFGFKMAGLTPPDLSEDELSESLASLRQQNVKLVYWPADKPMDPAQVTQLGAVG